jgi:hypothetical protein
MEGGDDMSTVCFSTVWEPLFFQDAKQEGQKRAGPGTNGRPVGRTGTGAHFRARRSAASATRRGKGKVQEKKVVAGKTALSLADVSGEVAHEGMLNPQARLPYRGGVGRP